MGAYWNICQGLKGTVVLYICRKYMNDAQPWYFRGNPQNCLTAVTEHALSWYLDIITWNFEMRIQKYLLVMQKIFFKNVVLWDVYFENSGGGGPDPKELYSDHQTYYMAATRKVLWRPQNNYLAVAILLLWWPPDKSFRGRKIISFVSPTGFRTKMASLTKTRPFWNCQK